MKKSLYQKLEEFDCIIEAKIINLSSGITSNVYYDIKKAAGIPSLFNFIIKELENIIPDSVNIVGVSTGGIPYASVLAFNKKTNFAYIRESRKEYGTQSLVEGVIDFEKEIYIIDDVCTTGNSIMQAKQQIMMLNKNAKCKLVSVVNRNINNLQIKSLIEL